MTAIATPGQCQDAIVSFTYALKRSWSMCHLSRLNLVIARRLCRADGSVQQGCHLAIGNRKDRRCATTRHLDARQCRARARVLTSRSVGASIGMFIICTPDG